MGKTIRHKLSRGQKPGRGNTYGLCMCIQCKAGRRRGVSKFMVQKIKRRWRHYWKQGKEFVKGLYTD